MLLGKMGLTSLRADMERYALAKVDGHTKIRSVSLSLRASDRGERCTTLGALSCVL